MASHSRPASPFAAVVVYQKDLGGDADLDAFDPDESWTPVTDVTTAPTD